MLPVYDTVGDSSYNFVCFQGVVGQALSQIVDNIELEGSFSQMLVFVEIVFGEIMRQHPGQHWRAVRAQVAKAAPYVPV